MPSFAIPKFTVLLEPLWVPAVFLLLSTGPLFYLINISNSFVVSKVLKYKSAAEQEYFRAQF